MKNLLILLTLSSTLLVSCDRQTLDGLNLKFQGSVQSDYSKNKSESPEQSRSTEKQSESNTSTQISRKTEPSREVKPSSDSDKSLPFNPLESCSQGGIVAQTNEEFYQKYSEVKSIDSKDQELTKEWKAIKAKIEQKCADKP